MHQNLFYLFIPCKSYKGSKFFLVDVLIIEVIPCKSYKGSKFFLVDALITGVIPCKSYKGSKFFLTRCFSSWIAGCTIHPVKMKLVGSVAHIGVLP